MEAQLRLARRASELWETLQGANPLRLGAHTGAAYAALAEGGGVFTLPVWGRAVRLSFPAFQAEDVAAGAPLDTFTETLLAHYFTTSDGAPLTGRWVSFADLPDGRFYAQAFQGYTGQELARFFGNDLAAFAQAAEKAGCERFAFADAAFAYQPLPRVRVLAAAWQGDEDFPASYRILFDAAGPHHLTTDGLAIVGSGLTRRLLKAAQG